MSTQTTPAPGPARSSDAPTRVCIVGSGWRFTSGISYYTHRLSIELATRFEISTVLMRRLIPARLYPGRDRVGQELHARSYPSSMPVFDGVDWFWVPSIVRAARFLWRQRPSVVVFQWWTGAVAHSYLVLAAVARVLGARVVVEFHETQDTGEAQLRGVARYTRAVARLLFDRADGFVFHSEFDRAAVSHNFDPPDVPGAVIAHGPYDHHRDDRDDRPGTKHLADEVVSLLFFGTIRPYKGLEHLVQAFQGLSDEDAARFRLTIVGETWEGWGAPLDAARDGAHADRISIVNRYVHDDEVTAFFTAADLVVLPYIRSSASGPLHIAMAHGLPVIVTEVGGLREGAAGYEGARFVPASDPGALRAALLEHLQHDPQRYVDPRSWTDTVTGFATLLQQIGAR